MATHKLFKVLLEKLKMPFEHNTPSQMLLERNSELINELMTHEKDGYTYTHSETVRGDKRCGYYMHATYSFAELLNCCQRYSAKSYNASRSIALEKEKLNPSSPSHILFRNKLQQRQVFDLKAA